MFPQAAVVHRAEAQRERVIVQWDDSRDEERCLNTDGLGAVRPTHLLMYDGGQLTTIVVKAGGWLRDGDGDAHRVTKQGHLVYVDQEMNIHRCDQGCLI